MKAPISVGGFRRAIALACGALAVALFPAQAIVAQHIQSFQEFPPRQKPGSFSVDQAMQMLTNQKGGD